MDSGRCDGSHRAIWLCRDRGGGHAVVPNRVGVSLGHGCSALRMGIGI